MVGYGIRSYERNQLMPNDFRVVQPYGRDKARESTIVSEHATAVEAFAEIDRLSSEMLRTGAPSNAVELLVIAPNGQILSHPHAH